MVKIKFRFITKFRIYLFILTSFLIFLLYNSYNNIRNEVDFSSDINYGENKIKTNDDLILTFADSIEKPKFIDKYVALMRNDTIISYRRKLSNVSEFVYMFGIHEIYDSYDSQNTRINLTKLKKGEISEIQYENILVATVDSYLMICFWVIILIGGLMGIIVFLASIFDSTDDRDDNIYSFTIKFYYVLIISILEMILVFYGLNYGFWTTILYLFLILIEKIIWFEENDGILQALTHYGRVKHKQQTKSEKLYSEYEKLLGVDKSDDIEKKKKRVITI